MRDYSYEGVMSRMSEIIKNAVSVDYNTFERKGYFDYEALMGSVPYSLEEVEKILHGMHVGNTPIVYMDNLTKLARKVSPKSCW